MSGICGIVRLDGAPAEAGAAQRMLESLAGFGDSPCVRVAGSGRAVLGARVLRVTPESASEAQPLVTPDGTVLVADARIDNRDELCADLGIAAGERAAISDSQLILAAWRAWGEDLPRRLLGDFAFILWDEPRRTVIVARDAIGQRGLFWNHNGRRLLFASTPRALLATGDLSAQLNEQKVADYLVHLEDPASTYYRGIERIPPGHVLVAGENGVRLRRFWWPDAQARLELGSDAEYLERFRAVFGEAVAARLRTTGDVGVMMSGGLDSASVAGVAAATLRAQGRRLRAFHHAPPRGFSGEVRPGWIADESDDVRAAAAMHPNIVLRIVRPDGTTPLDHFAEIIETVGGPIRNPVNLAWFLAIYRTAAAQGVRVMLNGQKGNAVISFTGLRGLRDLARRGHVLAAMREARAVARVRGQRPRDVVMDQVIRPLLPRLLFEIRRRVLRRSPPPAFDPSVSAIAPAFAREMRIEERLRERRLDDESVQRAGATEYRLNVLTGPSDGMDIFHTLRARFGIETRDPTSDLRVIEYCLSIPNSQYLQNGRDRLLVRRAMRDVLPASLLDRRTRGAQDADWTQWFGRMRAGFQTELERLERSETARRCLDLPRLRKRIEDWPPRFGIEHLVEYNLVLLRAMMVGCFLRWFEETWA